MSRKYNDFMNWYSSLSSAEQSDVDMLADDLCFPLYPECSDEELDILQTSSPSSSKTDPMMDTYVVKIWHEDGEEVFSIPANSPSAAINDAKRIWTGSIDRLEIIDVNPEYGDEPKPLPFKAATDVTCGKDMDGNEVDWIVDYPIPDDPSFNRRMMDLELADEADFYDRVHHEGEYEDDDYDYAADYEEVITSTKVEANTWDKISYLQDRISDLEDQLKRNYYLDPDELIDTQLELEDLREQLNFAWQDDEAEYNYALQQQEFNPDGSLKGYDDIYESTQVTASSVTFPETISIKLYPNASPRDQWVVYKKDYEHEDGGCYYYSEDNSSPVTSQFVSLYPDGSLTYLWDGVEKPFNKEWREEVPVYSSTSVTASKIIDNDKIQKGLIWNRDWHQFTVQSISPDHKTCKVSEEWVAEDSGEEIKRVYTYKIEEDEEGKEYCYDPKYEKYKDEWWGKMYAQGADNYEFDWDMRSKKLDEAYDKARNNDSKYVETEEDDMIDDELLDDEYYDEDYTPSATHGDYSPSNPWDAPGMSIKDFI